MHETHFTMNLIEVREDGSVVLTADESAVEHTARAIKTTEVIEGREDRIRDSWQYFIPQPPPHLHIQLRKDKNDLHKFVDRMTGKRHFLLDGELQPTNSRY